MKKSVLVGMTYRPLPPVLAYDPTFRVNFGLFFTIFGSKLTYKTFFINYVSAILLKTSENILFLSHFYRIFGYFRSIYGVFEGLRYFG